MKIIRQVVDAPIDLNNSQVGINKLNPPSYLNDEFAIINKNLFPLYTYNRGYEKKAVLPISDDDVYYTVEKGFENRMELISYKFYGTVLYSWIIMDVNNIINPFFISVNHILRIPSLNNIKSNLSK